MPKPAWFTVRVSADGCNAACLMAGCSLVNRAVVSGEEKHFGQEKSMQHFFSALGAGVIPIEAQSIPSIAMACVTGGGDSFSQAW